MNIDLNNFLPTIYESSLNKIYKDYPGWEKTTDYFDGFIRIKRCDTDGDKLETRIPALGYNIFLAPDPIAFAEHLFGMKYHSGGLCSDVFTNLLQKENTSANNKSKLLLSSILSNCQIDLWKNKDGSTTDCWFSPILKRYINPDEIL